MTAESEASGARLELVVAYLRWLLAQERPFRAPALAERFGVTRRTAQRWLSAGVQAGLVERVRRGLYRRTSP